MRSIVVLTFPWVILCLAACKTRPSSVASVEKEDVVEALSPGLYDVCSSLAHPSQEGNALLEALIQQPVESFKDCVPESAIVEEEALAGEGSDAEVSPESQKIATVMLRVIPQGRKVTIEAISGGKSMAREEKLMSKIPPALVSLLVSGRIRAIRPNLSPTTRFYSKDFTLDKSKASLLVMLANRPVSARNFSKSPSVLAYEYSFSINGSFSKRFASTSQSTVMAFQIKKAFNELTKDLDDGVLVWCSPWEDDNDNLGADARVRAYRAFGFGEPSTSRGTLWAIKWEDGLIPLSEENVLTIARIFKK